jgi:hypothetical protein
MRGRNNGGGGNNNSNNNNNNNNNRRGPNPLTRNYESNGPDVKIRGSAQQIAEKYSTLARDAMSSGDRVMAENYLQHAEHYNRIIAAAQAQFASQQIQTSRDDVDDDMDDFGFEGGMNGNDMMQPMHAQPQMQPPQPSEPAAGMGPQPVIEGTPAEVALNPESGTQGYGGRNRERRERGAPRQNSTAAPATAPEEAAPQAAVTEEDAVAAAPAEGEGEFQPRRGRRPRRGERRDRQPEGEGAQPGPEAAGEPALTSAE